MFHTHGVNADREMGLFSFSRTLEGQGFVLKDADWWNTLPPPPFISFLPASLYLHEEKSLDIAKIKQ